MSGISANFELIKETLYGTAVLEAEQTELQSELEVISGLVEKCIRVNASLPLDQDEYQKRYDALCARFESAKSRLGVVTEQIADRIGRRETIEQFLTDLMKQEGLVTEFDPVVWHTLVDVVTVYSREDVRFRFKDGAEIQNLET